MLHIVRHGRTEVNAAGKLLGRNNPELDQTGRKQAEELANRLGEVDLVISSPLKRTMETASYISNTVKTDPRWLELDYGELEGKSIEDIDTEIWERWRSDIEWAPDGGESLTALGARVTEACEDIVEISKDREVVVVTHVSPVKATLAWVLGLDAGVSWKCHVSPGSSMTIKIGQHGPILHNFNQVN
ncbi:MAG: histidine phosphatase family protein [Acidimicrobiales bacterium]|nr:histidine phosphatase family protein [Acidimicrobiales bacterium]